MSKEQEALNWLEDNLKGIASYDGWFREFHKNIDILQHTIEDYELCKKALDWIAKGIFYDNNQDGKYFYRTFKMVSPQWLIDTALSEARKEL